MTMLTMQEPEQLVKSASREARISATTTDVQAVATARCVVVRRVNSTLVTVDDFAVTYGVSDRAERPNVL